MTYHLNQRAREIVEGIVAAAEQLRVRVHELPGGARAIDCGVEAEGGLGAGLALAQVCTAGLAEISLIPGQVAARSCPHVLVATDHPTAACMFSQYAGWQIGIKSFFAIGSGPMRAAAGREKVFESFGYREQTDVAVGVLEGRELPNREVLEYVSERTGVPMSGLTLLVAPTASQAGGVQVVARSVETALHKLFELGFDLERIRSGYGTAPLPPVAKNDLAAIGRTNDAMLYGARVTLWVRGDDASLEETGPKVPSSASGDHGAPFVEIFERYGRDFYKIDAALFSPAEVTFANLDTGRSFRFGRLEPELVVRSFFET